MNQQASEPSHGEGKRGRCSSPIPHSRWQGDLAYWDEEPLSELRSLTSLPVNAQPVDTQFQNTDSEVDDSQGAGFDFPSEDDEEEGQDENEGGEEE